MADTHDKGGHAETIKGGRVKSKGGHKYNERRSHEKKGGEQDRK